MEAVLITGASSGIGYDATVTLAQSGYIVFAGVRNSEDQIRLTKISPHIRAILLDVTNDSHVKAAFDRIEKESFKKIHLINNAGIVVPGPIEILPLENLRAQFEVNVFSLVKVTQVFLPLLRQTQGRLIHIGSVSGLASSPFVGAYSASKFAIEAIADSQRWELGPSGVKVILIEPGAISTPIWKKGLGGQSDFDTAPANFQSYYGPAIRKFATLIQKEADSAIPVRYVTAAIQKALQHPRPPARIKVLSLAARIQLLAQLFLPTRWMDRAMNKILFKA